MQTENHYTETDLGNVSPNPRGEYDNAAKYEYLDLVTMQGGSYLCLAELGQTITGTAPEPGKTTELWQCLAMPGDRTPEYTDAHDKVVRLAKEVAQDAAKVAEDKQSVTQMETNARQLKEQAEESARQAENSKDSAAGSARGAKKAEESARQAENNVGTLVNGFDTHVEEKTTEATQAVATAKDNAVQAVGRQETASVQAVKDQTTTYITEQKNLAKQELDKKVEQFGIDVNAIKAEVSEEGQKQITNVQEATTAELAKIAEKGTEQTELVAAEGNKQVQAVQTAAQEIIADRVQIQKNKTDIASLTQNKADAIVNTATGEHIAAGDSSGHLLDNLKIYGKTIQSGEPTPDKLAPMNSTGDNGKIEIGIHGKQLFDASKLPTKSAGGATVTNNGDGSFMISGSGKLKENFYIGYTLTHDETIKMLKKGHLYLKGTTITKPCFQIVIKSDLGNKYLFEGKTEITNELLNHKSTYLGILFYGEVNTDISPGTIRPMLYQDGDGTWEPYAPLQSLSVPIPMPDNLRGVPVESGGNYADATGQQWVSDVIDLKRGKWTQCIDKIILNGTEDFTLQSMNTHGIANFAFKLPKAAEDKIAISNYFKKQDTAIADTTTEGFMIAGGYSLYIRVKQERADTVEKLKEWLKTHNVTVIYGLAKPIEKDIPQEALTAYKKLHSNYPSTVVQNTEGAGMELSYVADTKNYTDNKIKEAVSAQTQSLANLLSLMPLSTQAAMIETDTNNILDNMEVEK